MKFRNWTAVFCVLLSGAVSLSFEVIWTRWAVLIVGTTTQASTLVFATFMAGLALGSFAIKPFLERIENSFRMYGIIELVHAGVSALIGIFAHRYVSSENVSALLSIFVLLIPTFLMGLTTPLLIQALVREGWEANRTASWIYGANTVGGALGALSTSFLGIPKLGLFSTQMTGSFLLVVVAIVAFFLARRVPQPSTRMRQAEGGKGVPQSLIVALALAVWGGAASLALEVVWMRLLSLLLGPSVYALGIVLFVYLISIALGAFAAPSILRKLAPRDAAGILLLALAFSIAWSVLLFGVLPYLFVGLVSWVRPGVGELRGIELVLSAITLFPTAFLHGLLLPIVMSEASRSVPIGQSSALCLGANTSGSILGAALAGLWLIPHWGFMPVLLGCLLLHGILGGILFWNAHQLGNSSARKMLAVMALIFAVIFAFNSGRYWDQSVLASGIYKYAVGDALQGKDTRIEIGEILFYREGISSTVAVVKTMDDRILSVDGKADASARGDRSTQVLLGALPLSLSKNTGRTMVIGFASGVTAGVASLFPDSHVHSVEIEPAVYEASNFFLDVNHGPLNPPNHSNTVADARHFLRKTNERFDVITSEPSNPWMSGVAPLFTYDFFTLARNRLSDGGVMCQWLPIYGMSPHLVLSVLKTFSSVFPNVLVFESVEGYDLLLIGSNEPVSIDPTQIERRWTNSELSKELEHIDIRYGADLVGRFFLGTDSVREMTKTAVINTDDNGYLEYGAPLSLHLRTAERNHEFLSRFREISVR